jgi:hypothetical protein
MGPESTGICRNRTGIHRNGLESTGITAFLQEWIWNQQAWGILNKTAIFGSQYYIFIKLFIYYTFNYTYIYYFTYINKIH